MSEQIKFEANLNWLAQLQHKITVFAIFPVWLEGVG